MLKKSLQTITWGDPQHQLFDHIFAQADQAGFDGVEIGFRRLGQVSIPDAQALFAKHQIRLSGCHVGGNLVDLAQAENERSAVEKIVNYITALDCDFLIYSGLNTQDDAELRSELSGLRTIAGMCADHGKRVLYHNHDWEFRNDRRIWTELLNAEIEGLGFAPDLGWAKKGGQGMGALLADIGPRVETLHFKDFLSWDDGQNTCHLGDGVVDFAPAWAWLDQQSDRQIWLTAEQDNATDNDLACKLNGIYLTDNIGNLGS